MSKSEVVSHGKEEEEYVYIKIKKSYWANFKSTIIFEGSKDVSNEVTAMFFKLEAIKEYTVSLTEGLTFMDPYYLEHVTLHTIAAENGIPRISLSVIIRTYLKEALVQDDKGCILTLALQKGFCDWFRKKYSYTVKIEYYDWIKLINDTGYSIDIIDYGTMKCGLIKGFSFHKDYVPAISL